MKYRRSQQKGGIFFFTINVVDRRSSLLTDKIDLLRVAFRKVKATHPFDVVAVVVLPDHLHLLMQLPEGDNDFPKRIRLIKTYFSKSLEKAERIRASRVAKGERGIWQRRYWEHQIRDDVDLKHHVDYIHINPVKHGYVLRASDWRFSSIHRYIERGDLPLDWASVDGIELDGYGEL